MTDYSQNGEQAHILNYFGDFVGTFIDIGACDGRLNSNTLALTLRGWSGILIEPSPRAFLELQKLHESNPKLKLIHAAIGLGWGIVPFWDGPLGYSTHEAANLKKWSHLGFDRPFWIPTIPVTILEGPADFVSIDTEGTSVDVFLSFPFSRIQPRVMCVEHDGRFLEVDRYARELGYQKTLTANAENLVIAQ